MALLFALFFVKDWIDYVALHERGARTICTVLRVTERRETTT
ncbi:hypothetical protein ACRAKI_22170 [Saccharothrix isguenensis]